MATDRFSRHLKPVPKAPEPNHLVPDADFSRNVAFHVIRSPEGADLWMGRYLSDLIEVLGECHPEGVLVDIDGISYHVTVAPVPKGKPHGKNHSPRS